MKDVVSPTRDERHNDKKVYYQHIESAVLPPDVCSVEEVKSQKHQQAVEKEAKMIEDVRLRYRLVSHGDKTYLSGLRDDVVYSEISQDLEREGERNYQKCQGKRPVTLLLCQPVVLQPEKGNPEKSHQTKQINEQVFPAKPHWAVTKLEHKTK
ncbi:hypothetical protein D6764_00915 [Candidatus Woesearchaeota archaeon]|nr:MAG: hypothetical protein D6764_00915 [Candidatus Woesearchaeota archaeon]